jgi:transposase InsO family protein
MEIDYKARIKGNCLDNACVESFLSHLKTEAFAGHRVMNKDEVVALVEEHICLVQ